MGKLESAAGLIALATLLCSLSTSAAEYYTWVDENGVVNYSERNPQGYSAEHVSGSQRFGYQRTRVVPDAEATSRPAESSGTSTASDDQSIDAQIADEKARINQEIAAAKRSNCLIGKRNLAQLEAYARIRVKDDDGSERVLDDKEKTERIERARKTIRENCTG